MTMNPREKDTRPKKEDPNNPSSNKFPNITPSSRHWSSHKNPRIVRVSRAFGGKDRHSKVCTVRGLRDRRIRLSIPTAVQLYELQDRLGLAQPSKVVDWLIEATKNDIDKLPPLPMLPHNFAQLFHQQPTLAPSSSYEIESDDVPQSSYTKDFGASLSNREGFKMAAQENDDQHEGFGGFVAQNLFPLSNINQSCFPNMPYSNNPNYFHFDAPSLSLSQLGEGFPFSSSNQISNEYHHHHQLQNNNLSPAMMMNFPPSSTPQLYFCPSTTTIPSLVPTSFPPGGSISMDQNEWRSQINNHTQQSPVLWPTTTLQLISSPIKSRNVNSKTVVDDIKKDERNFSR